MRADRPFQNIVPTSQQLLNVPSASQVSPASNNTKVEASARAHTPVSNDEERKVQTTMVSELGVRGAFSEIPQEKRQDSTVALQQNAWMIVQVTKMLKTQKLNKIL